MRRWANTHQGRTEGTQGVFDSSLYRLSLGKTDENVNRREAGEGFYPAVAAPQDWP